MRQTQGEMMEPMVEDSVAFNQNVSQRRCKMGLQICVLVVTHTFCFIMGYHLKDTFNDDDCSILCDGSL